MNRWFFIAFILFFLAIILLSSTIFLYFYKRDKFEGLLEDFYITLFIPKEKREYTRFSKTPVTLKEKQNIKFGVEEITPESYLVFGFIVSVNKDWVVVDTGKRNFKLFKDKNAKCFAEIPTEGTKVEGEFVNCDKQVIPLKSYAGVQVEYKTDNRQIEYSYLRFIKPDLYQKMMLNK